MTSKKVFLVAGPSGCGKSAFIKMLRSNTLSPDIKALLPRDCESWPPVEANNLLKIRKGETDFIPNDCRAILHYDITFIHRFAITDYAHDPFCALLSKAEHIEVIYIKPKRDRLIHQFVQRREDHRKSKSRAALIWTDWIRLPLKRARLKRLGLPTVEAHELYKIPGFLDECYASWEAFLRSLTTTERSCRVNIIEPSSSLNSNPSFRLLAKV